MLTDEGAATVKQSPQALNRSPVDAQVGVSLEQRIPWAGA
jgi:hypothetical protein